MSTSSGWIGVDLDGTLARYDGWKGIDHIGEPIEEMKARVLGWLGVGIEVRIFTARVGDQKDSRDVEAARKHVEDWCEKHIGTRLQVTNLKDFGMIELWDDRAVRVEFNTGRRLSDICPT